MPFRFRVQAIVDVELTNLCGADCSFCPRDQTPHQGVMAPDVFEKVLERVVEFRQAREETLVALGHSEEVKTAVSFCGLGDQLLNRRINDYIASARGVGLGVVVNTNGQILDRTRAEGLLRAGVDQVMVNGGEVGERYESIYQLPFAPLERNVVDFLALAPDPEQLCIVLVDHDHDAARRSAVRAHWESLGVRLFRDLQIINRGGTLRHTHADYATHPHAERARQLLAREEAFCVAPSVFPFVAYDGRYLLCGSDWRREVVLPTVFDCSIIEVLHHKYQALDLGNQVCAGCNHLPHNRVADMLAEVEGAEATGDDLVELLEHLRKASAFVHDGVAGVPAPRDPAEPRRLIPVRAVGA